MTDEKKSFDSLSIRLGLRLFSPLFFCQHLNFLMGMKGITFMVWLDYSSRYALCGIISKLTYKGACAVLLGLSPNVFLIRRFMIICAIVKLGRKFADVRIDSFTIGPHGTVISGGLMLLLTIAAFFQYRC